MKKYPKIGIRPTIDGRQGGVRESLEDKTMNLAKAVAELISSNLKNGDGSPVECVIADSTIGRVAESAACAEKFEREGVGATITVTSCWCYGSETMDMHPHWPKDTDSTAVKLRAEDGRSIKKTDISMFINDLPNGKDTTHFYTEDASGSTSQAANVVEAMEAKAGVMLIDEDTSATNFMIRDELMQRVIHRGYWNRSRRLSNAYPGVI